MKTKSKVLLITIISVLALTIIGMTIGLVLVARTATLNNQLTVSYVADNVDCEVVTSAMKYPNTTNNNGEAVLLSDGTSDDLNSKTYEFKASDNTATGGVEFNPTSLTSSGRIVYKFEVTNTANSNNTKELKVLATITGDNTNDNVTIKLGRSEIAATEYSTTYYNNIGIGGNSTIVYVILSVTDATQDVNNLELGITLQLSYTIADPDADLQNAGGALVRVINNEAVAISIRNNPSSTTLYNSGTHGTRYSASYDIPDDLKQYYAFICCFDFEGLTPAKITCIVSTPSGLDLIASDTVKYDEDFARLEFQSTPGAMHANSLSFDGSNIILGEAIEASTWEDNTIVTIIIEPID